MFDPERDGPHGNLTFWHRVALVAAVTAVAAFAMWPSISGFDADSSGTRICVALRDGWHGDRSMNESQLSAAAPEVVNAYHLWMEGDGACVPESRHRLILSGVGIGVLAGVCVFGVVVFRRRTRTNLRPSPTVAVVQ